MEALEALSGEMPPGWQPNFDGDTPRDIFDRKIAQGDCLAMTIIGEGGESFREGLMRRLSAIEQDASLAGADVQAAVRSAIDNFTARAVTSGGRVEVPGRAYQALDTQFGQITKLGTPMSHYIGRVQGAIREAMDGSISPADRVAWRKLREEYGNRKTIRDLVAKESGEDISPRALMGRATANNAGKERMASGTRGEVGTLARIGQRMVEPPSSGTAERLMVFGAGAGAYANAPLTLGALLAGRLTRKTLDSSPLARLLMSERRGRYLQPAARIGQPLPLAPCRRRGRGGSAVTASLGACFGPRLGQAPPVQSRGR